MPQTAGCCSGSGQKLARPPITPKERVLETGRFSVNPLVYVPIKPERIGHIATQYGANSAVGSQAIERLSSRRAAPMSCPNL
jgi:hypothetical protein